MMKRHLNPLYLLGLLLFLGSMVLIPAQPVQAQAVPWTGLFFSTPDFSGGSQFVVYQNGLSVNWGPGVPTNPATGVPLLGIPADGFSARFTANTTIAGGLYEFLVVADGGVNLSINGQSVISAIDNRGLRTFSSIINLVDGAYLIVLDYVDYSGDALVQVSWAATNGTPSATGGDTTPPAALGEVVQVQGLSVRSGPFLGGTMLGIARPGGAYPIIARNTQEGLFTWYLIQYDIDTQGWVSGRYFAVTQNDPASLPIINVDAYTTVYDPPGLVTAVARSNMNFRVLPTQRAARVAGIEQLDWGATVEILARTRQGGQDFWYMVRYNANNTSYVGWVFAPFMDIIAGSDPIETIPSL
ncbi:MAG: PA14 domain-containing protein [Phototrophicaceae bacterium]